MIEIKKSYKLKLLRVSFVSLTVVFLLLISSSIIREFREFFNLDAPLARFIFTSIILFVAVASIAVTWLRDRNKRYVLEGKQLIITNNSFGSGNTKKIIKLEPKSVSSINLKQSSLGKILDYGTISIEVDNYSQKEVLSLANIENPHVVIAEINSHFNK
jgi:hypothetical protein